MAYISQITLPSGTTYDIKDAWARTQIEAITGGSAVVFKGVSTTALTDGGNENPTVGGTEITTKATGELYFYQQEEFIYGDDSKWHSLGESLSTLGALAYKDSASGSYTPSGSISGGTFTGSSSTFTGKFTPSGTVTVTTNGTTNKTATVSSTTGTATYTPGGTVSQPTFSGASLTSTGDFTPAGTISTPTISVATAGTTASVKQVSGITNMVSALATAAPGATAPSNAITYYSVAGENLSLYQIGATKAAPCSTASVTVKTGDASYSSSQPTFTGTEGSISVTGTPSGTVSQPSFSGTGARLVTGNIAVPNTYTATFAGTEDDVSTSGTPNGSVSNLSFTGTSKTVTVS